MGLWKYALRVAFACAQDIREHVAVYLAGTAANAAAWVWLDALLQWCGIGGSVSQSSWLPVALLIGSVAIVLFRAQHRLYADIAVKVGEGIVVRILSTEVRQDPATYASYDVYDRGEGAPTAWYWFVMPKLEIVNNSGRLAVLAFAVWVEFDGKLVSLETKMGADERLTVNNGAHENVWLKARTAFTPVETLNTPALSSVEVTDFATEPAHKLTLTLQRPAGRLA